jgi:hypothetical protein
MQDREISAADTTEEWLSTLESAAAELTALAARLPNRCQHVQCRQEAAKLTKVIEDARRALRLKRREDQ